MKRYDINYDVTHPDQGVEELPNGDWVKYEDVEVLQSELTRLKEINREMVELIKRIDLDVDDLIAGKVNMVNWAKRSLEISQTLSNTKAEGEKLDG